ncbi:uncharacterized protein [Musca autumnalis]|uniref:uncharacterized protein n=1 Tax=Musca autumnalis TaxID=221902 RepID=UPI003CF6042A
MDSAQGLDGRVAHNVERVMNFTMKLLDPDPNYFGERLPNGSYNGAIGSILDHTVDICFTGFFIKDYLTQDITFSVAMYDDQLCIYTRKAERVPDYLLPIFAIKPNVWISFITIGFLASVVWAILRISTIYLKIHKRKSFNKDLHHPLHRQYLLILKDSWVLWVRQGINHYPQFESEKVWVVALCLVSMIFGAIIESSLASSHIEPLYFQDINTLAGLDAAGLEILYRHASMKDDLFVGGDSNSELYDRLNNKTLYMPNRNVSILKEVIDKGKFASVNRYNSLKLESMDVLIKKQIWIIPEFPKHYSIAYVWLRDAPWEETVNRLLLMFQQAGIISKFERDTKNEAELTAMKKHLYEVNVGFRILTIRDFQLAFYVISLENSKSLSDIVQVQQNGNISTEQLNKWLNKPIKDIPYLHVMLRGEDFAKEDVDNIYIEWFLKQTQISFTLNTYKINDTSTSYGHEIKKPTENSVVHYVIVTNFKDLHQTSLYFAHHAGIYFFIILDEFEMHLLREISHMLWTKYQIFKMFFLTNSGVFVYDVFAWNSENGEYGTIIPYTGEKSLERTLFHNMRGYPLRVQLFRSVYSKPMLDPITNKVAYVYGVDGRVSEVLQQHLNFTMDLLDPDPDYFGERSPNGTYNGAIGSIIKNELDLCLTGFFVKDYMVPEMEFSVTVYDDMLCIYTPKAEQIPESILPILSVGYDLWLVFIFSAFVCGFIWVVLRYFNLRLKSQRRQWQRENGKFHKPYKWQMIRIFIDTWVVWVRVNINRYPPFSSEKVFIASLCLVSVIFGAIFESSLATVYIHPLYYRDIHTMEELDKSGLHVIYKYTSMGDDLFFSETSPLFANLNKKLRHLKDLDADVLKDVVENGGKAGVTRYTTLMLEYLSYIRDKKVWVVPECPKYYTISYVWHKNAPWEETVNQLLLRMQSAGLFEKFIEEMQTDVDIKLAKQLNGQKKEGFKVLTVGDLQLAFYVVLLGSLMGLISLLVERRKRKLAMDSNGNFGALVDVEDYNMQKIFHNMNGYPLQVYIFDSVFSSLLADGDRQKITGVKGTDGNIAYLLASYLNFSMELQWPDDEFFGSRLENGSFNGALGRLMRQETDICLTGFFVKDYLANGITFSTSVYMDKLCCYVMKAKHIPASILPLYAVDESIWLVYIIVGCLSSFFWMLLRRANLKLNPEEVKNNHGMNFHWLDIFTDTWLLWVRRVILRFPPSNAERIFAISLCLVSVIIGAVVDSSLATVFIKPLFYKDINTLTELNNANLRIFYKHAAIKDDLFTGHSSEIFQSLDKRMLLVGEPEERLISIMAKRGKFAAVTRAYSLDLVDIYYFITNKVFMIPECPKVYHISYPMQKYSPFEEEINVTLLKILAGGLINYWIEMEKYVARSRIHHFEDYDGGVEHKWKILNITDLQLAFYVLGIGLVASFLVCLGEQLYYKCKLSKTNIIRQQ